MARGNSRASSERTVNVISEMARAEGIDASKMSTKAKEAELIAKAAKATRNPGYPASGEDLRDIYAERSYEMRANGMRPPAYTKWLTEQVQSQRYSDARTAKIAKFDATPEGAKLKAASEEAYAKVQDANNRQAKNKPAIQYFAISPDEYRDIRNDYENKRRDYERARDAAI